MGITVIFGVSVSPEMVKFLTNGDTFFLLFICQKMFSCVIPPMPNLSTCFSIPSMIEKNEEHDLIFVGKKYRNFDKRI